MIMKYSLYEVAVSTHFHFDFLQSEQYSYFLIGKLLLHSLFSPHGALACLVNKYAPLAVEHFII